MKIGMLTSGGDCQGLNAALRGVAKTLYNEMGKGVTLYGIRDGYRGLIEGDYTQSIVLFAAAAVIAVVALVMHEKILHGLSSLKGSASKAGRAE